jgi:hypothetical protein
MYSLFMGKGCLLTRNKVDAFSVFPPGAAKGPATVVLGTRVHHADDSVGALSLHRAFYSLEAGRGLRWNDSAIGIAWPAEPQERLRSRAAGPRRQIPWPGIDARLEMNNCADLREFLHRILVCEGSFSGAWLRSAAARSLSRRAWTG